MFLELHVIQNFAPSNLNRDDTGNPKDCEFGGVRRARVSSQSFKRAIRTAPIFAETTGVDLAARTRWVARLLRKPLVEADKTQDEADAMLARFVPAYLSKMDSKKAERTAVLIYISPGELDTITTALLDQWDALAEDDKALGKLARDLTKQHKNVTGAPDIALFGRMLAEKPDLNIDAACQVAHAISTHRVTMEMDFFTAVDDLQAEEDEIEETGAGMMGFTGFDSACFYRYVRLDWPQLLDNLGGDTALARRTVEAFLRAVVEAVPSGKQNTFAAHNPPSLMLAAVRQGGFAWSLANAFERPIRPRADSGLIAPSAAALDTYWGRMTQTYGTQSLVQTAALALDPDLPLESLSESTVAGLDAWLDAVLDALPAGEANV
jgi:CRISPR system Cascade subunit CasC